MTAIYAFSVPERLCKVKEEDIVFFLVFLYVIYQIRNRTGVKDIVCVASLFQWSLVKKYLRLVQICYKKPHCYKRLDSKV
jgi:hypothetical protein